MIYAKNSRVIFLEPFFFEETQRAFYILLFHLLLHTEYFMSVLIICSDLQYKSWRKGSPKGEGNRRERECRI